MKIYADLKINGVKTSEEFKSKFKNIFKLDDIQFYVPSKKGTELVPLHLDFNEISWYFKDKEGFLQINLKSLADTWVDLNLEENSYTNSEISLELLQKGYVENYVLFLEKQDGNIFTDITIQNIGYLNNNNIPILFKISSEAINEA